jgi:hypothetical protein
MCRALPRQASNYFGDDVLFVISALGAPGDGDGDAPLSRPEDASRAVISALVLLHLHPFADVEVPLRSLQFNMNHFKNSVRFHLVVASFVLFHLNFIIW